MVGPCVRTIACHYYFFSGLWSPYVRHVPSDPYALLATHWRPTVRKHALDVMARAVSTPISNGPVWSMRGLDGRSVVLFVG